MALTSAQKTILKTAIASDPDLNSQPMNSDGAFVIAIELNKTAVPDFYVWKTSVGTDEIMTNGFDWTRVDNLTVGKARIWEWMIRLPIINPSQANVRAGVEATFSVEAADAPNRNAVYGHFQKLATRIEKLFATGAGTASTTHGIGPATLPTVGYTGGPIGYQDIEEARNS